MIHEGRKRRPNSPGQRVGDPLLVSFFFFSFPFGSSSPISASIARVEVEGFTFNPDPFFLRSSSLVSDQLPGMGLAVSPSVPRSLSFSFLFSLVFLPLFPWHCCVPTPQLGD